MVPVHNVEGKAHCISRAALRSLRTFLLESWPVVSATVVQTLRLPGRVPSA